MIKLHKYPNFLGLLILLLFFFFACATKSDRDFLDFNVDEVENSLQVDKNKLMKFKIEEELKAEENTKEEITDIKVVSESTKQKEVSVKKKTTPKTKKKIKTNGVTKEVFSSKKVEELKAKSLYPKDDTYPKAFKIYDKKSVKSWKTFKPKVYLGERFTFAVRYLGITAGHIKMETRPIVKISGNEAYHYNAKLRSARFYSAIYTLDDSLDSYIDMDTFLPVKFSLIQRESSQNVDDLQLFDHEELKTYHFYKRMKKGKLKKVEGEKFIPHYFQDSYSALYFVRGFPMKIGDTYQFPIVTRGKIWILKIKIAKFEKVDVNDKEVDAIRLEAETHFPGVLEKKGDIIFWYSNDKFKKLLKFKAEVKIGSIEGELIDYTPGRQI